MFKLILMRHSIAVPSNDETEDFERKLTSLGILNCQNVGNYLKNNNFIPDLILVSSSARTLQTVKEINKNLLVVESNICPLTELYNAEIDEVLNIISKQDDLFKTILLVGHNPTISYLANILSNQKSSFYFDPAGFAIFDLNIARWNEISANNAKLIHLQI